VDIWDTKIDFASEEGIGNPEGTSKATVRLVDTPVVLCNLEGRHSSLGVADSGNMDGLNIRN